MKNKKFRVFDRANNEMVTFDLSDVQCGKVNALNLDGAMQDLGVYDASGSAIFEKDILRFYSSIKKQSDGSFLPDYEYFQIDCVSDLYGSPFRGVNGCDVIGNEYQGGQYRHIRNI